jgi:hypothetical protein
MIASMTRPAVCKREHSLKLLLVKTDLLLASVVGIVGPVHCKHCQPCFVQWSSVMLFRPGLLLASTVRPVAVGPAAGKHRQRTSKISE